MIEVDNRKPEKSIRDIKSLFRIRINSVENIILDNAVQDGTTLSAHMLIELYHGGEAIDRYDVSYLMYVNSFAVH